MGDRSNAIRTQQRSHFINVTTLMGPWRNLTLSGGVQGESTRREGIATGLSLGASPARFASGEDRTGVEGNMQLSYTGLKNTVLTLGARLRGESTDLREDGHINSEWGAEDSCERAMRPAVWRSPVLGSRGHRTGSGWCVVGTGGATRAVTSGIRSTPIFRTNRVTAIRRSSIAVALGVM